MGGQYVAYWLDYYQATCRDNPGLKAYVLADIGYIILCPRVLPPQNTFGSILPPRNTDYTLLLGFAHIEGIAGATSMDILHELFHAAYPPLSKFYKSNHFF